MKHHPACPPAAHVHSLDGVFQVRGWCVFVDTDTVVLTDERHIAHRIATLINRHGLADIPDHIPNEVLWAPPHPDHRLIDWRLPERPT